MMTIERLSCDRFPEPIGAYSNGVSVRIGDRNLIFLTGQIATDSTGAVQFPGDSAKQTEFIFENIKSLLSEAGATIDDIVKVVIYVLDMNDFSKISPVRNKYLQFARPVSTLVEVSKLTIEGCLVEIEVTAII